MGHPTEDSMPEIVLVGPSISQQHALITADDDFRIITVQPLGDELSKVGYSTGHISANDFGLFGIWLSNDRSHHCQCHHLFIICLKMT